MEFNLSFLMAISSQHMDTVRAVISGKKDATDLHISINFAGQRVKERKGKIEVLLGSSYLSISPHLLQASGTRELQTR